MASPSNTGLAKLKVILVLRGRGKADAIAQLQQWTLGQGLEACPHIPLGNNKAIRVVNGYKQLVAMANAVVWDEILALSQKPDVLVALAAARLRFLARIKNAPVALTALLQATR